MFDGGSVLLFVGCWVGALDGVHVGAKVGSSDGMPACAVFGVSVRTV